jgi:hypothetical protein
MVPPTDISEVRHVLGVFVQSKDYIPEYAHIVAPITALTRNGTDKKPVPFLWTVTHQHAFDTIRNTLLDGVHLSPPDYRLPLHGGGDASIDGKAFGLYQYSDVTPTSEFTVTSHGPEHTTILLKGSTTPHDIPHTDTHRRSIVWFSKCWSDADRKRAPFYLEADALLWGLDKSRFWALSSPFPLYAHSDHLPLKWIHKCERGFVSSKTIEDLSDLHWVQAWIKGTDNSLFDSLSRYPMLSPRVLAPTGLVRGKRSATPGRNAPAARSPGRIVNQPGR